MREILTDECCLVAGGITENQCIGLFTAGGGFLGFIGGGGVGLGTGMVVGGALGNILCVRLV